MNSKPYFDQVSNAWDNMRKGFFSEKIKEKMCDKAAVKAGESAADIGAGTGFITQELLNRGVKVTAIDQSEEMLRILKEKFGSFKALTCLQGDAYSLPLRENRMDYVMANMFLHHIEDPRRAIFEMTRILKPEGKLIITDLDKHEHEFLRTEQHDVWLGFERTDIRNWLEQAGLKQVQVECLEETCSSDSTCSCDRAAISIWIASAKKEG